jgi:DNA-binding transcriptional regulator LsrR (DeoR family)
LPLFDDDEAQLISRVAWLYFNDDLTQAEIGARLGIPRLKVTRLLQAGRDRGLIRVVINTAFADCVALESRLAREFGLVRALVSPTPERGDVRQIIGRAAGEYVSTTIPDGASLGVGWGRTIREALAGIVVRAFRGITVTSLYGGVPKSPVNPFDSTAMFARAFKAGVCNHLAAPMFVSTPEVRETIAGQEAFRTFYADALRTDILLTAVGDMTAGATNIELGAVTLEQRAELARAGAVGEFLGGSSTPAATCSTTPSTAAACPPTSQASSTSPASSSSPAARPNATSCAPSCAAATPTSWSPTWKPPGAWSAIRAGGRREKRGGEEEASGGWGAVGPQTPRVRPGLSSRGQSPASEIPGRLATFG